jgi:hypothetical protein
MQQALVDYCLKHKDGSGPSQANKREDTGGYDGSAPTSYHAPGEYRGGAPEHGRAERREHEADGRPEEKDENDAHNTCSLATRSDCSQVDY